MLTSLGQASLPTTCPICQHTPISAEDCSPSKSLRLTVRAFLKSEEKKREREKAAVAPVATVLEQSAETVAGAPSNPEIVEVETLVVATSEDVPNRLQSPVVVETLEVG